VRLNRIDRYVWRELAVTTLATAAVLLMVMFSGLFADLFGKISRGKLPPGLLLSLLGLRSVDMLPLVLPLALFLGVLLGLGRLYRDSEMSVLASVGLGVSELRRAIFAWVLPLVLLVGATSLWLAPAAQKLSAAMIEEANRSLLVVGLEPGRFVELPGRDAVVYLSEMSEDGSQFGRLFVHNERDGRIDVVTAKSGELYAEQGDERYLSLRDGFRVEGSLDALDFRLMRFERNDIRVPDSEPGDLARPESMRSIPALLDEPTASAMAELHWRLSAPLATLLLALLALPLAHTPPRSARYGGLLVALLGYVVYMNMLGIGRAWMAAEVTPIWLGLWWPHGLVLLAIWWLQWWDRRPFSRRVPA